MKLPEMSEHQAITVRWTDAYFDFDHDGENFHEDWPVETTGYYVCHGTRFLHFAMEVLPHGNGYRGMTHIPLVLIDAINGEKV